MTPVSSEGDGGESPLDSADECDVMIGAVVIIECGANVVTGRIVAPSCGEAYSEEQDDCGVNIWIESLMEAASFSFEKDEICIVFVYHIV